MTNESLALSYLKKATDRLRVLDVLMEVEAYSDVVREAQEILELALKAMLREVGIEPPKWHDVGSILKDARLRFPRDVQGEIDDLARDSAWLREHRELAFYGDENFIPTEEYGSADGERATAAARRAVDCARRVISPVK
jgi:hypothetical protein